MILHIPLTAAILLALALPAAAQMLALPIPPAEGQNQISVKVTPGLTQTRKLPTAALRQARKDMLAGLDIGDDDLRALADQGDGLAALRYTRRLVASDAASASDIAYYGSLAVSTGRVWVLPDAVAAMARLDPETEPAERKKTYLAMLYPHAWAGNALALDAVIDLNGEGRLFGAMSEATRQKILEQGEKNGDGRAALRLALPLLHKQGRSATETAQLQDYLKRARAAGHLAVATTADTMLALLADQTAGAAVTQ